MADLASKCRRQVLLNSFGEDHEDTGDDLCCDVCKMKIELEDLSEELNILVDAIDAVGAKGEVKIAQWFMIINSMNSIIQQEVNVIWKLQRKK